MEWNGIDASLGVQSVELYTRYVHGMRGELLLARNWEYVPNMTVNALVERDRLDSM